MKRGSMKGGFGRGKMKTGKVKRHTMPAPPKGSGAHATHQTMNVAHGTPQGFAAPPEYAAGAEPTADESCDHGECMTE